MESIFCFQLSMDSGVEFRAQGLCLGSLAHSTILLVLNCFAVLDL